MIKIKSHSEIEKMKQAGKLAARVLNLAGSLIKEGISTLEINDICHQYTIENGALSSTLNYNGFPKSLCASINDVVCHGIPSVTQVLRNGDIVNIDITVTLDGYYGDTSRTFIVGSVNDKIRLLVERTRESMFHAIKTVKPNAFFGDIGKAINRYIKPFSYGIVEDFCGHGIGSEFHEDPVVLHYKTRSKGKRMKAGMCFTIEPMINMGSHETYVDQHDGWTVYTKDKSLSAQFEHTILVTKTGYEILTLLD